MKERKTAAAAFIAAVLMLTACGSSDSSYSGGGYKSDNAMQAALADSSYSYGDYESYSEEDNGESAGDGTTIDLQKSAEKMVYTASVNMETLDYDNALSSVMKDINDMGGFVENSSESNDNRRWYYADPGVTTRSARLTVRIPTEKYSDFLNGLSAYGQIVNKTQNAENISRQYGDTQAQIQALEIEQERLLEMMNRAETIEEMIYVEERLTTVQGQLNRAKSSLSSMDTDVAYSTVTITLDEVHQYTEIKTEEPSFGERFIETVKDSASSFASFAEELLFVIIYLLPYAVIAAVIVVIVLLATKKKRAARKAERERIKAAQEAARAQGMNPAPPVYGYQPPAAQSTPVVQAPDTPGDTPKDGAEKKD